MSPERRYRLARTIIVLALITAFVIGFTTADWSFYGGWR